MVQLNCMQQNASKKWWLNTKQNLGNESKILGFFMITGSVFPTLNSWFFHLQRDNQFNRNLFVLICVKNTIMISSLCFVSSLAFFTFRHIKTSAKISAKAHKLQRKLLIALCAQVQHIIFQHINIKRWGDSSLSVRVHSFPTVHRPPFLQNNHLICARTECSSDHVLPRLRCCDSDPPHIGL